VGSITTTVPSAGATTNPVSSIFIRRDGFRKKYAKKQSIAADNDVVIANAGVGNFK
jgi:hypothetical protein